MEVRVANRRLIKRLQKFEFQKSLKFEFELNFKQCVSVILNFKQEYTF